MKPVLISFIISLLINVGLLAQDTDVIREQKIYKTVYGKQLTAYMFYTAETKQNLRNPAIAFFHGGGWAYGSPSEFHTTCIRYAKKGFVTFSFQYRLSVTEDGTVPHPDITLVECVKDARSALRWVRENAVSFNIDPDKIIAAGQSAGGQLALSTAMFDDINEETDNMDISPVPNALLLFSSNLNTMEAWADWLMGERRKEIWSVSPYHNLKPGLPPAIEFHGTEDCMVPIYIMNLFKEKTLSLGNYFESIVFEGRGHYLDEGNDTYSTYYDEDILKQTDKFLEKFGFINPIQIQLPYDRLLQPAGMQIYFGVDSLENHALDAALSPDGKWLTVMERFSIIFISTSENKVKFRLPNDLHPNLFKGKNTYSGITWHTGNDGYEVYWSVIGIDDRSFIASAKWDGVKAEFGRMFEYMAAPETEVALPNEFLITKEASGEFLYVVLNGNNNVIKQDFKTGDTIWVSDPGVAPYGLTMASGKLFVTNWAGRHPEQDDKEVAGVPWGLARVNNMAGGGTREGSVAVIDPSNGNIIKEFVTGLHPNEITSDKKGKFVYVTNSNSDNVTVIDADRCKIAETISVRLQPGINPFWGDSPNGLCLSPDGKILYVANGMDNALAVIKLGKNAAQKTCSKKSMVTGFIPTGAYPSSISILNPGYLYVCNLESEGVRLALNREETSNLAYNSHHMMASVSVIPVPDKATLKAYTDTVIAVNDISRATLARENPRQGIQPKPVPDRIGEPSVFKHVLYIIRENRTYDQVLGDMKQGKGDPALCIYGEQITPNAHKLCEEFILLDNFHVSGKCSAEGHQWTDASIVTDYIEKNMRAWFRSYPHVQKDALVYAPTGFLWDNAIKHGRSVRIYGEASSPVYDKELTWTDIYKKYINGEELEFSNSTTIEPVRNILCQAYPSYGSHVFTDQMRADALIRELNDYEAMEGDHLPELMIVALPNDHTAGSRPDHPTPRAMVADNDLALGRIVEAFSKSRFWENTVIFVVEDDSQGGWDHVSAYRTISLVISPYSRLRSVNHTYYNQPSIVRTIEQILGLSPMNIQDAIANPMIDCFNDVPDITPFTALSNNIPIDEMNPPIISLSGKALHYAKKSMLPEFDGVDAGSDDLLNRILWFTEKGNIPYPAKYAGTAQDERKDTEFVDY